MSETECVQKQLREFTERFVNCIKHEDGYMSFKYGSLLHKKAVASKITLWHTKKHSVFIFFP